MASNQELTGYGFNNRLDADIMMTIRHSKQKYHYERYNVKMAEKPANKIRAGGVTVTAWDNKAKDDKSSDYRTFQVERSYKVKDEWKTTNNFNKADLPKLASCVRRMMDWDYENPIGKEE